MSRAPCHVCGERPGRTFVRYGDRAWMRACLVCQHDARLTASVTGRTPTLEMTERMTRRVEAGEIEWPTAPEPEGES